MNNPHRLARELAGCLRPLDPVRVLKVLLQLSYAQRELLYRAYYQYNGSTLQHDLRCARMGYLSLRGYYAVNSLDSVYERACALAQLEATSGETFVLTPPQHQLGELVRLLLEPRERSLARAIFEYRRDAVYLIELLYAAPDDLLERALGELQRMTRQQPVLLLINQFQSGSDAKFLVVSRISALRASKIQESIPVDLATITQLHKQQVSVASARQHVARLLLLRERQQIKAIAEKMPQLKAAVPTFEQLLKLKFAQENQLIEYAFRLYCDSCIDPDKALAHVLRRGIRENRDFAVCWVLSAPSIGSVLEQYKADFLADAIKNLKAQSSGVFKKAVKVIGEVCKNGGLQGNASKDSGVASQLQ